MFKKFDEKISLPFIENKKYIINIIFLMILSAAINTAIPLLNKKLVDDGLIKKNLNAVVYYSIIIVIFYLIESINRYVIEKNRNKIYCAIQRQIYFNAFSHLLRIDEEYFNSNNIMEIIQKLEVDIDSISSLVDMNVISTLANVFLMIGGIIGLLLINFKLTIIILLCIPIKIFIEVFFIKKNILYNEDYIVANEKFIGWFSDHMMGITDLKLYLMKNRSLARFDYLKSEELDKKRKLQILLSINEIYSSVFMDILIILINLVGAMLLVRGKISVGTIITYSTYSLLVLNPISMILQTVYYLGGVLPSYKRLDSFFKAKEEKSGGDDLNVKDEIAIQFDKIYYKYMNKNSDILKNVNLKISSNQKIAIFGPNGSGKSTLIDLILRLKDPSQGKILVNGKNINNVNTDKYRKIFSVVHQNSHIFDTSIYKNIDLKNRFDEEMKNTIMIYFYSLIHDKNIVFNSGLNGILLSEGQKQIILILRAIAQHAKFIVLDEATSHIDQENLLRIYKILDDKKIGLIVISHQREILNMVDEIIFMKEGEIRGIGSFTNLLKNQEFYALMKQYE